MKLPEAPRHEFGTPPLLYAEEQLRLRSPCEGYRPAAGLVGALLAEPSAAARVQQVRAALAAIGFNWLDYGRMAVQRGRARPLSCFISYAQPGWTRHCMAQRHFEADPRHEQAPVSGLPLVWDLDGLAERAALDGRHGRFIADLDAAGLRSGLLIRLASAVRGAAHESEHTVIGLSSSRAGRQWIGDAVLGQALMLGLNVHDYLSRHVLLPEAEPAGRCEVSATQQFILDQLLQGRADKEIAYRLQLSLHAVDYHMRQLRRRFAARNRLQLVNAVMAAQQRPLAEAALA
jgi:DNA-binding CsgD family transcriptional regulator